MDRQNLEDWERQEIVKFYYDHAIRAGRADGDDVLVEHHERQPGSFSRQGRMSTCSGRAV